MSEEKSAFVSARYSAGQLNAIVKMMRKQAGDDAVECFLRGKLTLAPPSQKWLKRDGVFYLTVRSDGTSGREWIERLEGKDFPVEGIAKKILLSPDFKPTNNITYQIAIANFDSTRTNGVRQEARDRGWVTPNAEIACLIREKLTSGDIYEIGYWWLVVMHQEILTGDPATYSLLFIDREDGGLALSATDNLDKVSEPWGQDHGFAFVVDFGLSLSSEKENYTER